jgi:hypothetical protein
LEAHVAAPHPNVASGGELPSTSGAAHLSLHLVSEVNFAPVPEREPEASTFGAVVSTSIERPGLYQITLSDEAWIDVVQDAVLVRSSDFSSKKGCEGVRKSVRFELRRGPVTIQISGAKSDAIEMAIGPANSSRGACWWSGRGQLGDPVIRENPAAC